MKKLKELNLKGHLLTAISYLIPIVCGAGFLIAIGNGVWWLKSRNLGTR